MDELEKLLRRDASALERFVRFRIPDRTDAEDVLQEVLLTATTGRWTASGSAGPSVSPTMSASASTARPASTGTTVSRTT